MPLLLIVFAAALFLFSKFKAANISGITNTGNINEDKTLQMNTDAEKPIPSVAEIKAVLGKIALKYSPTIAKYVELIYRAETTSKYKNDGKYKPFNSLQFRRTYSPGMLKMGKNFPYGWTTINNKLWQSNPEYSPNGDTTMRVGNKDFTYLSFPSFEAAAFSLAAYLDHYKNPLRWNSTDPAEQAKYNKLLTSIKPRIWNEIFVDNNLA